jgi:putative spermidine/putrescine transport system ATP-binding protein/spermidine/putrescine transport system ATP-binding protein
LAGVEVRDVSKSFGATMVLDGITAGFADGKLTSLLGASGSGKTTLLRIVAGFLDADRGEVRIDAQTVTHTPVWRRNIGMVFQSYALFPHMTVAQNIAFGLHRRGIRGTAARQQVERTLEMVRLTGLEQRRPQQLSGGQQQRVALARAIVIRPNVLLLDEPLSALDRRLRQDMQVELRRIQREVGVTTIFVTHDQEEALTLSDEVAILDRGHIVQIGAPAEVYERPRTRFAATFLGDANFLEGRATPEGVVAAGTLIRTHDKLPVPGTSVIVAVRPEKMAMLPANAVTAENALPATLRQTIYAGATSTHLLAGPHGESLRVFVQNREPEAIAPGTPVILAWPVAHTVIVEP